MADATAEEILDFWFADALANPVRAQERLGFWFQPNRETDKFVEARYAQTVRDASRGLLASWEAQPRSCLALVIVLDQFPRNMHRGTAAAFQHDEKALAVTRRGVGAGHLDALATVERDFLLMPYQHCEDVACQREGVALYERMVREAPAAWRAVAEQTLHYARLHREIVERFGRFPHRNAIVGRASTPAEVEYLAAGAESFGQRAG